MKRAQSTVELADSNLEDAVKSMNAVMEEKFTKLIQPEGHEGPLTLETLKNPDKY